MEWKKKYAEACVDALHPSGEVLEAGFGSGDAAERIEAYHPSSHTILVSKSEEADKARDFAAGRPHVTVVAATWQQALPSLGKFDSIFFHAAMARTEQAPAQERFASLLIKAGQMLLAKTAKKFTQLTVMRYSDEDLEFFLRKIENKGADDKKMVLRFFTELYERGQITQLQWERACSELITRGWATEEEIAKAQPELRGPFFQTSHELLDFLALCIGAHMKKGARFSCILNDTTSMYEDIHFSEKIIENPLLDYSERWLEEQPRKRGLVMTITKQA